MTDHVDVVFPCLNEAKALPSLLASLPTGFHAIVVDNGSTDGSADIARRAGALVVSESRRGYGAAVHAGLLAARSEIVVVSDADGTIDPAQFAALVDPVREDLVDLTIARRRPTTAGAWPLVPRIANWQLARMLRKRTGSPIRDLGPARAAGRADLLSLDLNDRRSGYPVELVLKANAAGWRIEHVDLDYYPRVGHSKVTGTARGALTAVLDMHRRLRESPQ